ncbi:MAG TPA: hypothetical protein DCW90_06685 [Lachnospiraceae bacterium]|nr:hypothetical protein [uncultured Lachnoclostridium sp.]HAU85184.1 hypothetical protein [Lachnospiraceae bacterium]
MNDAYHSMFDKITLSEEKKKQILQLSKNSRFSMKRRLIQRRYVVSAACLIILIFFMLGPTRVYARKIFHELIRFVSVNEEMIELAPLDSVHLTIPNDLQEIMFEGTLFQYKPYDTLASLEKNLNMDVLEFGCDYKEKNNQVNFQVQDHVAGSINMLIDTETSKEVLPISYTLYFSVDDNVSTGQLTYKDENDYVSYDYGEEKKTFHVQEKYKVIERYKSLNLNTDVLILEKTKEQSRREQTHKDESYYVVFVYDKVEYLLHFYSDLEGIKNAIERMK